MNVLIIGSSKLPVPAVKGGAVPSLIEELIQQNEIEQKLALSCLSLYDSEAVSAAQNYPNTNFIWAKVPEIIKRLDSCNYFLLKHLFHVDRLLSLSFAWQIVWFSLFIAKELRKNDYDRVVFENSVPVLFSLKLFNNEKKYAGKYYLHMHAIPRRYYGNAKQVRECKRLICVSDYVARVIASDKRLNLSREKPFIMYNCVDHEVFHPIDKATSKELRAQLGLNHGERIVVFAGRLCAEKGVSELIQAFRQINQKDCILLVVGANFYKSGIVSPFEARLQEQIRDIDDRVFFTGFVDYSKISDYYSIADAVVLPSIWDEPAGMTIIESMACGKALITTDSGGIPEYVGEDNCIIIKRDGQIVDKIANNISLLLDNSDEANRLGENAYKHILKYDRAFYYQQLLDVIEYKEGNE